MGRTIRSMVVAGTMLGGLSALSGVASAQEYGGTQTPPQPPADVLGETVTPPAAPTVLSAAAQPAALPLTGGDVAGLTAIGVVLVAGGAVVVTRRRTAAG